MDILFTRFIRFAIVGTLGMAVDFGSTYLFKEKIGIRKYIANSMGFSLAVCFNYVLNRYWTFHSQGEMMYEFLLFLLVSLVGLLINNAILWLTHRHFGYRFYFAKLVATGITVAWNFLINNYVTFQ